MPNLIDDEELKRQLTPNLMPSIDPNAIDSQPALNPAVADYLKNKYPDRFAGLVQDKQKALSDFDTANPTPGLGQLVGMGFIDALKGHGSDLEKELMAKKAAQRETVARPFDEKQVDLKNQIGAEKAGLDMDQEQAKIKTAATLSDPNSDMSKRTRDTFSKIFPKFAGFVDGMSANEIDSKFPWAKESMENARKEEENKNNHLLGMAKLEEARAGRDKKNADRETENQGKAYSELRRFMSSYRGDKGAQQASLDVLSADKALAQVKGKDLNKLTTQDLRLLAGELEKIATGGVGSEHGTEALLPNNLKTKYAEMKNFLSSNPTDANAAAYVKKNLKYLNDMRDVADERLKQYQLNIAQGYKDRVNPEKYQEAVDYINSTHASGNKSNTTPEQDSEAVAWAKANAKDPRAKGILKANGL